MQSYKFKFAFMFKEPTPNIFNLLITLIIAKEYSLKYPVKMIDPRNIKLISCFIESLMSFLSALSRNIP